VTGINHLLLSSGDPFPEGFQLALARDNRELQ
jgi:proline racemase